MPFDLQQAVLILERTPGVLDSWLRDLPDEWVTMNEGEETWSAFDVVGHMIHGERTDWMTRLEVILSDDEGRAFEPFDRFAQYEASQGKSLDELLDTFAELRRGNLDTLSRLALTAEQLDREGLHPELGRVTLGELLATWVVHDLGHVAQIARVMAKRYSADVGPWVAYLPVLSRR